jgi:hypothetical protein
MLHVVRATGLLLMLGTTAVAGPWSDFSAAFPLVPCQDGWMGCIVKGQRLSPNLSMDQAGAPVPADMRIGWFDLEGLPGFSPFPELSEYTGRPVSAAPAVAEIDPEDVPAPARPQPQPRTQRVDRPDPAPLRPASDPVARTGTRSAPAPVAVDPTPDRVGTRGSRMTEVRETQSAGTPEPVAVREPEPVARTLAPANASSGTADDGGAQAVVRTVAAVSDEPADCTNLRRLEPQAMLGRLSPAQQTCLEGQLSSASKQTDKDKISRVLMSNAWASNDKKEWEKLVKRHLDEIDRSDPDLCYKYAMHLSRKGVGAANAVIRWSDVALENKTVWTGETYTNRVYNLLKMRAVAAQAIWQNEESKYREAASESGRVARDNARNRTKVLAREWYEYAKVSGKSPDQARALCMTAAGTEDYCEGM